MNSHDLSTLFDQDYHTNQEADTAGLAEISNYGPTNSTIDSQLFNYEDPLRYANRFEFEPFQFQSASNIHFVEPHQVTGYIKTDGTAVDSYYRDGDGNPDTRLTKEMGGGYFRHDSGKN